MTICIIAASCGLFATAWILCLLLSLLLCGTEYWRVLWIEFSFTYLYTCIVP